MIDLNFTIAVSVNCPIQCKVHNKIQETCGLWGWLKRMGLSKESGLLFTPERFQLSCE